jgi:large subunit ribosomal protein L35
MPKLKTHKGAQKRFKVTAGKKVVHSRAFKSHLLSTKDARRKRRLGKKVVVSRADLAAIKKMLPYEF